MPNLGGVRLGLGRPRGTDPFWAMGVRPFQSDLLAITTGPGESVSSQGRESDDDGDTRAHCRCSSPYAASPPPPPIHPPRCLQTMALLFLFPFSHHQGFLFLFIFSFFYVSAVPFPLALFVFWRRLIADSLYNHINSRSSCWGLVGCFSFICFWLDQFTSYDGGEF